MQRTSRYGRVSWCVPLRSTHHTATVDFHRVFVDAVRVTAATGPAINLILHIFEGAALLPATVSQIQGGGDLSATIAACAPDRWNGNAGMIRELTHDDLPRLGELHARGSTPSATQRQLGERVYGELFPKLCLDLPWADGRFPSLLSEDRDGRTNGVLSVMNRAFLLHEEPIDAAVSFELFVDPLARGSLCGVQLLKQFLNGEQDLSLADVANEKTRQIWSRLGGRVLSVYGLNWMAVLEPCRFATSLALKESLLGKLARPVARVVDRAARKFGTTDAEVDIAGPTGEPLTRSHMAELADEMMAQHDVRPVYTDAGVDWLWNRFNFVAPGAGPSRQTLVRDASGKPLGWYIYQWKPGLVARVSQIVARQNAEPKVVAHLMQTLQRCGAPGAIGRVQPELLQTLQDAGCLFRRRSRNVLVHSRREDILNAFDAGKAFLSMLDGEGAVQIWNDPLDAIEQFESDDRTSLVASSMG